MLPLGRLGYPPLRPVVSVAPALFLAACSADLLQPRAASPDEAEGRAGSNGGSVIGREPEPGTGETARCETSASPIRRLSRFELERTLEAVFPQASLPDLNIPEDQAPFGFDNDHDALRANAIFVEEQLAFAESFSRSFGPTALGAIDCTDLDPAACGRRFVQTWGERVFRRPPEPVLVDELAALFGEGSLEDGAALALEAMLVLPEFLYHIDRPASEVTEAGTYALDAHSLASRLSYALWAAPPDDALITAAQSGRLESADGLRAEAERMLDDPRAQAGIRHFFAQWLDLGRLDRTTKLPEDGLDDELREAMKEETLQLVEALFFERAGTVRDLFTAPYTFVNEDLAELYGVELPAGEGPWFEVTVPGRSGVLTQASFLASHAHPGYKSPVLRGSFIVQNLLCLNLGSPPAEAESAMVPEQTDRLVTNRQRYDAITMSTPDCSYCHEVINNAGYAYETFDTMGRFVTEEEGVPIDASGELLEVPYRDALGLNEALGDDPRTVECATRGMLRYLFGGAPAGLDPCVVDAVADEVVAADGSLRELVLAVVTHPEFRSLRLDPAP
jgi:hypothetical protein